MVRRIRGKYKANTVSHLKLNNNDITVMNEICNTLVEQFAFNSPSDNYSHKLELLNKKKKILIPTNIIRAKMYLRCMSRNKLLLIQSCMD